MKTLASFVIGLGAAVLVAGSSAFAPARAADCGTACSQRRNTCLTAAKLQFRAAQQACGDVHASCKETCGKPDVPPADPSCIGACGKLLGACSRQAAVAVGECIRACKTGDADAAACLELCAELGMDDPSACMAEHETCVAGCAE
jgi:hypothetical protein